jgi:hypothetical protein
LIADWHIRHDKITPGNSKGNGLVERAIRTVKVGIRLMLTLEPDTYWTDHIAPILMAMRFSMARSHGYPPYTIVTGLLPILPSDVSSYPMAMPEGEVSAAVEEAYINSVVKVAIEVRKVVKARHANLEIKLQRKLLRQEANIEHLETLFHFKPGDKVLRRRKVVGKIAPKSEGVYTVVKVAG